MKPVGRASPSPPPRPNKTPSPSRPVPRPDTSRPLAEINNTASTPTNLSGDHSIGTSACLTPLSPVYLMYRKQQAKQNGMFTIRPGFPKAKENKPTTSRGNLLSKSFTHDFPYDSSSDDSSSVSASEASSVAPSPHNQVSRAATGQSLLHNYFPSPSSRASDAASEDSTLIDSLSAGSAMISPQSSAADSTLEEHCSAASTPNKTDETEEQASQSTPTGTSIDLKYSTSYVTESTVNTPEIFRQIPADEPTPVIRNTRGPSPSSDTMNTMATRNENVKTTIIDWAVPRPGERNNNESPSLSLPSMLGGGSAFEVSDLESPSLFAQTMTSEGSSDIYSQSVRDDATDIFSMGGLDHIHTPSMMSGRPLSTGGLDYSRTPSMISGRPRRSMNGLSTPELWSHARKHSTTSRGLQTAPASLNVDGRHVFFRSGVSTPSPRQHLNKEKRTGRPKTPVTLGSLLQDTLELQSEHPDPVFHETSADEDKEKSSAKDSDDSEELPVARDLEEIKVLDKTDDDGEQSLRVFYRRAAIALVILLAFLLALNALLIPLTKRNSESTVPDPTTGAPRTPPRMPVRAPVSEGPAPVPTTAPSNLPTSMRQTPTEPTAPTPTDIPAAAPNVPPTSPGGSPVARPSPINRPTTPEGSPVVRPSSAGMTPTEPPNWTAVLQGEQFWTDIGVQIELQWHQTYGDSLKIEILNALDDAYDEYLETTVSAWNASSLMELTIRKIPQDVACQPEPGKIKVCSAYYGNNGWRGQGHVYLRGRFINAATIQLNDYKVFDPDPIQYELCHLLGHSLGVYHADEGCLVPSINDVVGDDNLHPSAESLIDLEELYGQQRRRLGQPGSSSGPPEELQKQLDDQVHTFHV
jgi:hypothetical protein